MGDEMGGADNIKVIKLQILSCFIVGPLSHMLNKCIEHSGNTCYHFQNRMINV